MELDHIIQLRLNDQQLEAIKELVIRIRTNPANTDNHLLLAMCFYELDRFQDALKTVNYVLVQQPDNIYALRIAACSLFELTEYHKALARIIHEYRSYN